MAEFVEIQGMFRIQGHNVLKDYACADQTVLKETHYRGKRALLFADI